MLLCDHRCVVTSSACDLLPFDAVVTSCFSLSDDTLWLGTTEGLFTVSHGQDGCLIFSNVSEVTSPVRTLAWRSTVTDGHKKSRHPASKVFFPRPSVENHLQEMFASSDRHGTWWTGSYWSRKKGEGEFGVLVVGTEDKIHFHDGKRWWFEWVQSSAGTGGIVDAPPTAMTFGPSGELYIANDVSLTRLNINYTFDRIGALEGLPYHHLTSLYVSPFSPAYPPLTGPTPPPSQVGTLWIGTARGYTLFDIHTSEFLGYYNGPRWLPDGGVVDMAKSGAAVVLLTQQGLAVVYPELWTLEMKAGHYQHMMERHVKPPGLVSDCPLLNHTPSTCEPAHSDRDGLQTSWLVAAEIFRYHVTKEPSAKQRAWQLFSGLKFLTNVSQYYVTVYVQSQILGMC